MKHKNLIRGAGIGLTAAALISWTIHSNASEIATFKPAPGQPVHYYWGGGSPANFPLNNFRAEFDQSRSFEQGDYFLQTLADDGVRVKVDGRYLIDRWTDSGGDINRALWLNVNAGLHNVKTEYYENSGEAAVFSDIVPFDSWVAYYYPNKNLAGLPNAAKVIPSEGALKKLYENHNLGGPTSGFKVDDFSARYVTAKRLSAGDYILRTKADDGVRVYVDGKLVIDRWTDGDGREDAIKLSIDDRTVSNQEEKDVHWIE
ncbi:MAG: PA14 domain-containing protein, partial [Bacillus sp. (in: firmicutes)]